MATGSSGLQAADLSQQAGDGAVAETAVLSSSQLGIWIDDIGEGFRSSVHTLSVGVGGNAGFAAFGGKQAHDLALMSLSYGHMLGPVLGRDRWFQGNLEWRLEVFGGAEFRPDQEWVMGLTPHLRYNFATGTRLIPFFDLGAGVTATGIGPPDLSNTFEFNLQAGAGVQWFFRQNLALTLEAKFMHMSCAGISSPNLGLNGVGGMGGIRWFF